MTDKIKTTKLTKASKPTKSNKVDINLETLVKAGAHFGHQTRRWNPKIKEYIYGTEDGVHLFDLTKTAPLLEEALEVLKTAKSQGKRIVLVATKKQAQERISSVAKNTGVFFVNQRWLGGTITNFVQIKRSLLKLSKMRDEKKNGEWNIFTKKERLLLDREMDRLTKLLGGLEGMSDTPEVLFIVDLKKEEGAVREAKAAGITTVGVVDSNCDPLSVDYPIPMNDDSVKALEYLLDLVEEALSAKS